MSHYGKFFDFCRDSGNRFSTIPVCNLFNESPARSGDSASGFGGCDLRGISLNNNHELANLGSILFDGIAILVTLALLFFSNRKRAAVGRREMQYFLFGFLIISICEIFTIGGFPLNGAVRRAFTAIHIAAVVATTWVLLLNAIVGFQIMEDGTPLSMALIIGSSLAFIIGVGYIALDTAFHWTGYWDDTLVAPNRAYALYTLYLLAPLVFIFFYFVLEAFLVVAILGERRPLVYLLAAALLFAIGQIFQFVISVHICNGVDGKINGGMFETLFTLLAVVMIWVFWSSITEDDWPTDSEDVAKPRGELDRPYNRNIRKNFVRRRRKGTGRIRHLIIMHAREYSRFRNADAERRLRTRVGKALSTTKSSSDHSTEEFEMEEPPRPIYSRPDRSMRSQVDGCAEEAQLCFNAGSSYLSQIQRISACLYHPVAQKPKANLFDHLPAWIPPPLPPDPVSIQRLFQQPFPSESGPADIPLPPPTPDEHRPIPDPFYPNPGTRTPPGEPPSPQLPPPMTDRRWPPDLHLSDVPMELYNTFPGIETRTAWLISSQIFEPCVAEHPVRPPTHSPLNRMRQASNTATRRARIPAHRRTDNDISIIESLFNYSRDRTPNDTRPSARTSFTPDSLSSVGQRRCTWWLEHAGGPCESYESTEASVGERRWPRWWRRLSMASRTRAAARAQILPNSRVRPPPPALVLPQVPSYDPAGSEDHMFEWVDPETIGVAL